MEPLKSYQDTREVKENFPSESQSSEVQLYQYQYITSRFGKNVKNEELKKKIDQFFAPTHFFTKHATLEFFYGVANDTRKHLLLSEDSVKTIHRELEIFTSSNIPIPTLSTVQNNPYQNVEAIFIDSAATFTKINKELKKYNKKIRANYKLDTMKAAWERAQSMFKEKKYLFVAVDVESYERDHSCILEVGWSMFDSKNNSFMDRHFCVSEYKYLKNGQFVPDRKDRYSFGETVWANLKSIGSEIVGDLTEETVKGNVVFIGHDIQMDVKYLESMGVDVKGVINPVDYFDTAEMNAARVGKPYERINLGRLLDDLDIENYCLHNAGNDAHYTLLLFLELCKLPLQPPEEHTSNSD